jgi:hypothetical protein
MVSFWKMRRETMRLGQQLRGIGELLTNPARQRKLDRAVAAGLPMVDGILPASDKVALLLIYQPLGVTDSTLATCVWLSAAGYAPFVVSNAPISPQDRARLSKVIWRAVERPNFGYDFGGYRDGLTCLSQWGVTPDELLILNDSIWLPVLPATDLLDRLAEHPAEIAGTILRTRGAEQFLESYLYRLHRTALMHPGFADFWAGLRLTSNKYHVIRRGERGFSAAMQAAGLQVAGIYNDAGLAGQIAEQDNTFLRRTLRHASYIDAPFAAERDRLLKADGPDWRVEVLAHVNRVLDKRLGYSTFPYAMVWLTGYPLLKKSAEPVSQSWRLAHLAAIEEGDLPSPHESILSEVQARDTKA